MRDNIHLLRKGGNMKRTSFIFMAITAAMLLAPVRAVFAENLKPLVLFDFEKEADMAGFVRDSDKTTDFPTEKVTETQHQANSR
jgi:hypothetical protein